MRCSTRNADRRIRAVTRESSEEEATALPHTNDSIRSLSARSGMQEHSAHSKCNNMRPPKLVEPSVCLASSAAPHLAMLALRHTPTQSTSCFEITIAR
mmetsp:Transcript_24894/g.54742  ORF Transcript_24894/g.54742 Transcript_24894/m.54742 type:complete len:98 (-) Transcript_24894:382-675(-)